MSARSPHRGMRFVCGSIGFLALMQVLTQARVRAQSPLTLPRITTAPSSTLVVPVTAAEAAFHVMAQTSRLNNAVTFRQTNYPIDSIRAAVATVGAVWLAKLRTAPVQGIQVDPAGRVGVAAHQEQYAKAQIATRLRTPALSLGDRAFTYLTAVQAFANGYEPEQLPIAEEYLRQLDHLGDTAATWQFQARMALVDAYYVLGGRSDVIRHGTRAIELVGVMDFTDRSLMFLDGSDLYGATMDALASQPGGRARIDTLNSMLRKAVVPSARLVAMDSEYVRPEAMYRLVFNGWSAATNRLGSTGSPLISNYWLNRATSDSATLSVADGSVHVVEVGSYVCPPCLLALHALERLHHAFPSVQMTFATSTLGWWGNRLISPDDEVAHVKELFLDKMKISIPIAVWKAKKQMNADGGITPANEGPLIAQYTVAAKPTIWILDGNGTVRHIFLGYSREKEGQIAKVLQFLTQEQTSPVAVSTQRSTPTLTY